MNYMFNEEIYSESQMRNMIKQLVPKLLASELELQTITAKETVKGAEVVLEFRFGINGKEW